MITRLSVVRTAVLTCTFTAISATGASAGPAGRQQAFVAAAQRFHVPREVLHAVSCAETQREENGGNPGFAGGDGPMNLTGLTQAALAVGFGGGAQRTSDLLSAPAQRFPQP
jgi:hypothetical protein